MLYINSLIDGDIRVYKCPVCHMKFNSISQLESHFERQHDNLIAEGTTTKQTIFNIRNNKTYQICTICKKNKCDWNEKLGRYNIICNDPVCKETARKRFMNNYKKKHGKLHSINDPEVQKMLLFAKKNSGEYLFKDGGRIRYASMYERDFLELLDKDLKLPSTADTIRECDIYFEYKYDGKKHIYIPDYYMEVYNLIIEIKSNDNTHPKIMAIDKETELLKDKAVIKSNNYNYIKIMDKDYEQFITLLEVLKNLHLSNKTYDKFIIIPESKPPKNLKEVPNLAFIKNEKAFNNKVFIDFIERMKITRFKLLLHRDYIPEQYIEEEDVDLFPTNEVILRQIEIKDYKEAKKRFNEFDKYVTVKYIKFLNHMYMSTCFERPSNYCISLIFENDKDNIVEKILKTLKIRAHTENYIILKTKMGYVFVGNYNAKSPINSFFKTNIASVYKGVTLNESLLIPVPGTIDGDITVEILEDYCSVKTKKLVYKK